MIDKLQTPRSFVIRKVAGLDFPILGTKLSVSAQKRWIDLDFDGRRLRGEWNPKSRAIDGTFFDQNAFRVEIQGDDTGDRISLLCQIFQARGISEDSGDVPCGSWSADEDGDGLETE